MDDDPDILEALAEILEAEGFNVRRARNGLEALDQLSEAVVPNLVLLDLMMPVMDGYQFLEALTQRADMDRFGVLIASAEFSLRTGVVDKPGVLGFISKPFDLEVILGAIENFHPHPAAH